MDANCHCLWQSRDPGKTMQNYPHVVMGHCQRSGGGGSGRTGLEVNGCSFILRLITVTAEG